MSYYRDLVRAAVEATVIQSPTSYTWFGQAVRTLPAPAERAMTPATRRAYLVYNLQWQLYRDFYCQGLATPTQNVPASATVTPTSFTQSLSTANHGRGSREAGWRFCAHDAEQLVVERDGLQLWVKPEETFGVNGKHLEPGATVNLRFPKELLKLSPGFYMALGDAGLNEDPRSLVRFYWNLRSDGAALLLAEATQRLNRAMIPFRLKVASEPERYTRCDAGVLYVPKGSFRAVGRIVAKVYARLASDLKGPTPSFAKRLAPGLGLAEEPGGSDSFGTHRCMLLAEGLVRAGEQGALSTDDRLRCVADRFSEDGISLDMPYLNPGSADVYELAGIGL